MKNFIKQNSIYLLTAFFCTVMLMSPYLFKDFLGIEHDTFFHLSRIQGLADAISRNDWIPAIYPYKNNGFGYASSLFYSDFLLIPTALLYLVGFSLSFCYKQFVFMISFLSIFNMELLVKNVSKKKSATILSAFAYAFANYRITDIYVRGALGELTALAFFPIVILGMYKIVYEKDEKDWPILCIGLSLLALSHNISFLFGVIICIILFILRLKNITKELFISLSKAIGLAFLLTSFFTLPMIEQVLSQDFILKYWGGDMGEQSMDLWQYLANSTVFGYGGNNVSSGQYMLENIGWFLEFAPLTYFFMRNEKHNIFIKHCLIIGYIFILLSSSLIPWNSLSFLGIIQFPWRLSLISMTFLVIPATYCLSILINNKYLILVIAILSCEAIYHIMPAFNRTFGITSNTAYNNIIDGELCDPYYSADYVRVELAGGDYLNINHPDFRLQSTNILYSNGTSTGISYDKIGTSFLFNTDLENINVIVPLSYYKGYKVYYVSNSNYEEISYSSTDKSLISFEITKAGTYIVRYENTKLRSVCLVISLITFISSSALFILSNMNRKRSNYGKK